MFPTKRFLSTVTADEFSGRHILSDKDFLRVSEHRVAPEDSLNSQTDATTTKQKETEQEEDSAGIKYETEMIKAIGDINVCEIYELTSPSALCYLILSFLEWV